MEDEWWKIRKDDGTVGLYDKWIRWKGKTRTGGTAIGEASRREPQIRQKFVAGSLRMLCGVGDAEDLG